MTRRSTARAKKRNPGEEKPESSPVIGPDQSILVAGDGRLTGPVKRALERLKVKIEKAPGGPASLTP